MKKGIKITREQADQIIIDWNKGDNPHREVVIGGAMGWFDVRHLDIRELHVFKHDLVKKMTGKKWNGKEANIKITL